jgi:site-specific recombinase XerD
MRLERSQTGTATEASDQVREALRRFDSQLARQGRAPGTRARYLRVLSDFLTTLQERPAQTLSAEEIDHYLEHWRQRFHTEHGHPPALASYRGQINALRCFYRHLERLNLLVDQDERPLPDPTRRLACPAAPAALNDWLRPPEDQALLACPGTLQERFAVALLRWSGLRVSEAIALTLADLDLTPGRETLTVQHSKTAAGRRTLPIVPPLQPLLQEWLTALTARGLDRPATPLLATRRGTTLSPAYLWRIVKRSAHRAGVRPIACTCQTTRPQRHQPGCPQTRNGHNLSQISPHTLRRTYASDLLNKGLRLEIVSKLLGHASTTITQRAYAQLLDETTRRELLRALGHPA